MKITTLLETMTTTSSDPAANQSQQAPKFGRDPNVLEDEKLDETTAGAISTGEPTNMGVQRRGKGSMFQGIKTSKKFPNSAVVKEGVAEEQLDELSCWSGYHRVKGTKAGFPGSCAKNKTNEDQHSESCPHCGGEMVSEELMNEKKDACYYKVKSRYKVWPSAYASGALVKCRKKGASNWGNKSEGVAEGLSKRDQQDVAAIRAAIARLESQLNHPNADKAAIQQSIAHEKKRLALYGQVVAEGLGLYGPFTVTINTGERPQSRTKTKKFRREDDAILWAQDWLEDAPQYVFATAEVTDPEGNVVWTTDEQGVAEGLSDIVKGVKRKVAGKADPKEVEHMYGRIARSAIKHKTPDQAEKDIERYKKVSKVVNKEDVAEGSEEGFSIEDMVMDQYRNGNEVWEIASNMGMSEDEVQDIINDSEQGVTEGSDERSQNRLWQMITDYEQRAKATKNDIKKDHYLKMASELRGKLKTSDEQGVAEDQLDEKWTKKYKDSINCSDPKGFSQKAHCAGKNNESVEELEENLHKWFKEKWVRFGPDGKIRGDCARGDDSEGKPKCLPQSKAHSLGKKGRKYAASKKRREDPNPERRGPAKNVATKKKFNEGLNEAEKFPEPEQQVIDATRQARLNREREPQGSDKIDTMLAQRNAQLQQYNETGKFWLKKKDSQEHVSNAYVGKAAANQAAIELLKQNPELKGNIVITAWGPGETPMNEAELSEEQILAKDLKKQLELFKKAVDNDLGSKPNDKGLGKKPKDKEVQKK